MAFDVWPASVPNKALVGTYEEIPEPWKDVFEVEEGPPLEGPLSTIRTDMISYEIIVDETDRSTLMNFWRSTLSQGIKYFTSDNPEYGGTETYKFPLNSPPRARSIVPGTYRVSITLRRFR